MIKDVFLLQYLTGASIKGGRGAIAPLDFGRIEGVPHYYLPPQPPSNEGPK